MMTLAILASAVFLAVCVSGPVAAVAANNGKPILAVSLGVVAIFSGWHLWQAVPLTVGPLGLVSVACGLYAVARAFRGASPW
jgi:hypothetical protein